MVTMASSSTSSCSAPEGRHCKLRTTPARRNPHEGCCYELRTTPARCNPIKENSNAKQFRGKPLAFEDELTILFGSMTSKDGTMLCIGGTGHRAPSGWRDDSRARILEDNVGWSEENVGASSVGCVSQRSIKDHVVDSRQTKKTKSIEYYLERICESLLERVRNEREEVRELLQLVKEDGVSEGSELFFIATELFKSSYWCAVYRRMKDPKSRIGWLQWKRDNLRK